MASILGLTWDQRKVQKIISALLEHTIEGAKPIEGAGGDEGADVVAPMPGGELILSGVAMTI